MSNENKSEPAFPCELKNISGGPIIGFTGETIEAKGLASYGGMTLRDYFAASVDVPRDMSIGWAVSLAGRAKPTDSDLHFEWVKFWADAGAAYRGICADAMLAERAK